MGYNRREKFGGRRNFQDNRSDRGFNNRFDRFNNNYDRTPPVKVGDELNVTIEAVAEKGDGLAKKDGFVIFVPGTKQGDSVRIRVTKVLRRVGFAEKIGEASKEDKHNAEKVSQKQEPEEETEETYTNSEDFGEDSENF